MWILTIILLLSNGDTRTVIIDTDRSITGAKCKAEASKAWELNEQGLHVLAVNCSKTKDT